MVDDKANICSGNNHRCIWTQRICINWAPALRFSCTTEPCVSCVLYPQSELSAAHVNKVKLRSVTLLPHCRWRFRKTGSTLALVHYRHIFKCTLQSIGCGLKLSFAAVYLSIERRKRFTQFFSRLFLLPFFSLFQQKKWMGSKLMRWVRLMQILKHGFCYADYLERRPAECGDF